MKEIWKKQNCGIQECFFNYDNYTNDNIKMGSGGEVYVQTAFYYLKICALYS